MYKLEYEVYCNHTDGEVSHCGQMFKFCENTQEAAKFMCDYLEDLNKISKSSYYINVLNWRKIV